MAKNRKNVSIFDLPQEEVKQVAKQVQDEAMVTIPTKKQTMVPEATKTDKLKIIYVDVTYHSQAKATAAMRGMKLGEYIEHLISQDTQR
jgi:hypothetical protein